MKRGEKNRFKVALLIETPPQIQNNYSPSYNLFSKCRKKERKVRENTCEGSTYRISTFLQTTRSVVLANPRSCDSPSAELNIGCRSKYQTVLVPIADQYPRWPPSSIGMFMGHKPSCIVHPRLPRWIAVSFRFHCFSLTMNYTAHVVVPRLRIG